MNYLEKYCQTFNLTLSNRKILDKDNNIVGEVEEDKYVRFTYQPNLIKISDLLLLSFEEISVHN